MKVLVIDDDKDVRELISANLMTEGYEVLEAEDGIQGAKKATSQNPELIVTDIRMPGNGGLWLISQVQEHAPEIPVIVISGHPEARSKACHLGAQSFIDKPFRSDLLLEEIRRICG